MRGINRQRNILEFALASLMRRAWRNSALIAVYSTVVFAFGSALFYGHAVRAEARALLDGSPELLVQRMIAGRHDLIPASYANTIASVRGIRDVHPRLWGYYFDPAVGANYTLIAISNPEDTLATWGRIAGNDALKIPGPGQIVIGGGVSRDRAVYEGDIFPFRASDGSQTHLTVIATLPDDTEIVGADLVLMTEADFKTLFMIPDGMYTDISARTKNPRELPTIAGRIAERLPDTRPIARDEVLRTYDAVFGWRGGIVMAMLMASALAFAIFSVDRAAGLSADERREIGILKAVGWETSDVLLMKFWEGAVVSLTAFLIGVLGAWAHVFMAGGSLFTPVMRGWSVLHPSYRLAPAISALDLFAIFFLTVVPYTVSTIIPSWRAATTDPDRAMR